MTRVSDRFGWRPALVALVALAIFVAAVVPTGDTVARPGPLELLTLDLWLHASAYLVLELAVLAALAGASRPSGVSLPSLAVVCYGLALEGVQGFLAYRSASLVDAAANTVGVLLAFVLWTSLARFR